MAPDRIDQELTTIFGNRIAEMIGNRFVHIESGGHPKYGGKVDPVFVKWV